jgi:hypothetical protein
MHTKQICVDAAVKTIEKILITHPCFLKVVAQALEKNARNCALESIVM